MLMCSKPEPFSLRINAYFHHMEKYGYQGTLKAKAGKGKELANILVTASTTISAMPGCYLYLIAQDSVEPDLIRITEVWDTKESHDNSLKLDSVRQLIGQAMPLLDGPPEKGIETKVLGLILG